jgi:hypothetical protein
MKSLNSARLLALLIGVTLIVGTGSAQTWTVNGGAPTPNNPLTTNASESAVAINPVDGTVAIRTAGTQPGTCGSGATCVVNVSSNSSATPGQTISVAWSTSGFVGAVSCNATTSSAATGWSGVLASSPLQVTMPSATGNVTLSLQCTGTNGQATGSTTVNVQPPGVCTTPGFQPVDGGPTTPLSLIGPINFASTNWGASFPGINGRDWNLPDMGTNTVTAVEFIAPPVGSPAKDGKYTGVNLGSGATGFLLLGITPCAGELRASFNPTNPARYCSPEAGASETSVNWTLLGNNLPNSADRCLLVPGQRYFVNIGYALCTGTACKARVTPTDVTVR